MTTDSNEQRPEDDEPEYPLFTVVIIIFLISLAIGFVGGNLIGGMSR